MKSCCDKYNGNSNFTYPLFIIDTSGKHNYCVFLTIKMRVKNRKMHVHDSGFFKIFVRRNASFELKQASFLRQSAMSRMSRGLFKIPSPGWSCKDDTEEISTMLTDLLGLLTNANPKVVIQVLQSVKYEPLLTLVEYYQLVR